MYKLHKKAQKIDSDIILHCALSLIKANIPFSMIHDSLLVPTIHEKQVEDIMFLGYNTLLGSNFNCKVTKEPAYEKPIFDARFEDIDLFEKERYNYYFGSEYAKRNTRNKN